MRQTAKAEDLEMERMLALWERIDRRFWRTVREIMRAMCLGVAVGAAIGMFLTWLYHFVEMP